MRLIHRVIAFVALLVALPVPIQAQTMSDQEMAAVQLALNRGQLLYAYDQAAWHGTDDMMAIATAAGTWDELAPRTGGWIVDGSAAEPRLVFIDRDRDNPHALYVASFTDGGTKLLSSHLVAADEPSPITPERRSLIEARRIGYEAIAASDMRLCADAKPNTVVLPPETAGGPALVYFMTPQTENGKYPLGGHYRIEVSADGHAGEIHRFTNSCIELEGGGGPSGSTPAALIVSHLLDPTPTEIHVFSMLAAKLPLYVATTSNNRTWVISAPQGQAQIELLRDQAAD